MMAYRRARLDAMAETGLPIRTFPDTWPFTLDEATNDDFWSVRGGVDNPIFRKRGVLDFGQN